VVSHVPEKSSWAWLPLHAILKLKFTARSTQGALFGEPAVGAAARSRLRRARVDGGALLVGFGSGSTCYRCMVEWQQARVWERLHAQLLSELRAGGELEWSRAMPTRGTCRRKGGAATGPSPVVTARNGSKHHLLDDASGIPLAWTLTGGNRDDVTQRRRNTARPAC
jgi:hypothetical protein